MSESGFLMNAQKDIPGGIPTLDEQGMLKTSQTRAITPESIGAEKAGAANNALASHKTETNPHSGYALLSDPRFADSRTPRAHTHPSNEIIFSSPTWNNLNLLNAWTNKSGIAAYRKYASGIVEVRFWLTKATAPASAEVLFNLPTLHRPSQDYQSSAVITDSKKAYILGHLNVSADGNVGFYANKMDVNTEIKGRLVFGVD
ncbi:hypothetical protein [Chroococcidiopsis sp.]|uniref:hypothetical protein n=1 Tax=Chroococcidiopsis sp. TaxID=3088168 RepID=UPI003F3B93F2